MPIVTSEIREDAVQIDGRRYIREVHTDRLGVEHHFVYLAEDGQDVEAVMAARATALSEQWLREHEDQESGNGLYAE